MTIKEEPCRCAGLFPHHNMGDPGCRYRIEPQPQYTGKIKIPDEANLKNPNNWEMIINVGEAVQFNKEYNTLQEEHTRMKKALKRIVKETKDVDTLRLALIALGYE